jgi:hypothetical protein
MTTYFFQCSQKCPGSGSETVSQDYVSSDRDPKEIFTDCWLQGSPEGRGSGSETRRGAPLLRRAAGAPPGRRQAAWTRLRRSAVSPVVVPAAGPRPRRAAVPAPAAGTRLWGPAPFLFHPGRSGAIGNRSDEKKMC